MRRRLTRGAKRRRDAEAYYYVRRKRQAVALAGLALSSDQGEPNLPVGGGGAGNFITSGIIRESVQIALTGEVIDTILTTSAYDPGDSQILGNVQGVYGNQSVFGPGPYRVLIQGGIRYMIGSSIGSGGLR